MIKNYISGQFGVEGKIEWPRFNDSISFVVINGVEQAFLSYRVQQTRLRGLARADDGRRKTEGKRKRSDIDSVN